jgi:archaellum component FlaG (FlaF/FlaG flagellin family)
MALRSFSVDADTGKVDLGNDEPKEIANFVTFEQPNFELEPGQWINQRIYVDTPAEAGFSYSFAVMVVRDEKTLQNTGASIQGSVAVFALLNVNKPDATRSLDVLEFSSVKKVYEYLPATLTLKIKNTGNTIIAPKGNIFIARNYTSKSHIKQLQINQPGGYIVPGSTRSMPAEWIDGYPEVTTKDGVETKNWDLSKLSQLRIGKYTAKAIVIYDDGARDVPVEAVVSFWVFPWKILLGMAVITGLVVAGAWSVVKNGARIVKRKPKQE